MPQPPPAEASWDGLQSPERVRRPAVAPTGSSASSQPRARSNIRWIGAAAALAFIAEKEFFPEAWAGFTNPAISDRVYVERAKQFLGPISWHQQPDGSWVQRGGCVYVKLFYTDPTTGARKRTIASGVLLNEWTVVTAGHLVNKKDPTISVGWSLNCLVNSPDEIPVAQSHIHPGYLKNGPVNDPDIAVLILKTPAINKETGARSGAAFLASQPIPYDTVLELCGYGLTNNNLDTGEPRAGRTRLFNKNPLMGYSPELYESTDALYAPEPQLSGYHGDSGGLVLGQERVTDPDGVARMRTVCRGSMVTATLNGLGFTDYVDFTAPATRAFILDRMKVEMPEVSIRLSDEGNRVVVSWPLTPYNVQLLTSRELKSWQPLRAPVSQDPLRGGNVIEVAPLGGPPTFFRLKNKID